MLDRPNNFNQTGRAQDLEGCIAIDNAILEMFNSEQIPFFYLKGHHDDAVDVAFDYLQRRNK